MSGYDGIYGIYVLITKDIGVFFKNTGVYQLAKTKEHIVDIFINGLHNVKFEKFQNGLCRCFYRRPT
jgi:hypothetical protein